MRYVWGMLGSFVGLVVFSIVSSFLTGKGVNGASMVISSAISAVIFAGIVRFVERQSWKTWSYLAVGGTISIVTFMTMITVMAISEVGFAAGIMAPVMFVGAVYASAGIVALGVILGLTFASGAAAGYGYRLIAGPKGEK
jgi:hypothetical protein